MAKYKKRVTLHPLKEDGTMDLDTNLYPKTFLDGIVDRDGNEVDVATKEYVDTKPNLIEITWAELKALRDNNGLSAGKFYCITDYVFTSGSSQYSSGNHPFDIIVRADSLNTLNENATARLHAGDTYFSKCMIESWELKYHLDNDTQMFGWALTQYLKISTSASAETYVRRSINDVQGANHPYAWEYYSSFLYTDTPTPSVGDSCWVDANSSGSPSGTVAIVNLDEGKGVIYHMKDQSGNICPYDFKNLRFVVDESGTTRNYYTFNNRSSGDASVSEIYCLNNVIKSPYNTDNGRDNSHFIGKIIFKNSGSSTVCYYRNNTFGANCSNIFLDTYCEENVFGDECTDITLGDYCTNNYFLEGVWYSKLGSHCRYNVIGAGSEGIKFGDYCMKIKIGASCNSIVLGNTDSNLINYCRRITVAQGCEYLFLTSEDSGTSSNYMQNIRVELGVIGKYNAKKTITTVRNLEYETTYTMTGSQTVLV